MKTLLIDNYDSYIYNLYDLITKISKEEPIVIKNDEMTYNQILKLQFDNIVISSGPGSPKNKKDFGICEEIIKNIEKPIFAVSLGHQGIYTSYGGDVVELDELIHGRNSNIYHNGSGLFKNIKNGFSATRYHSLICKEENLKDINIDAKTKDGLIMAISHKTKPIWSVQFQPEAICTEYGEEILKNFFNMSLEYNENHKLYYSIIDKIYDSKEAYEKLHKFDNKILWLDSSKVLEGLSRFTIFGLSSDKRDHYLKYNTETKIVEKIYNNGKIEKYNEDIFTYLKENQEKWEIDENLPFDFQLGYIGYLGYELKNDCIVENKHKYKYPDAYFRYIDRAVIIDHLEEKTYILSYKDDLEWIESAKILLENKVLDKSLDDKSKKDYPKVNFVRDKKTYIEDMKKSKSLMKKGETYEVCLTNRLDIHDKIDPVEYYMILRDVSPGPYSALLNFPEISVACSSMERFIKINRQNIVETKPIKGTIRRGKDKEEDMKLIKELYTDKKTKSENLMIVDLLRNDLSKVCEVGSVNVSKLMDVETYSTLHQLVSTVSGKIHKEKDSFDVIKSCFPGGSMTGSPKKRTLEIIDELENVPRGVYSGSIGYISNNGTSDFNIVIRTALIEKDITTIGVGGAIIDLSDEEEEFDEILLKAKGILTALKLYYKGNLDEEIFIEGSI